MKKWFAVRDSRPKETDEEKSYYDKRSVWTISIDEHFPGWETDSSTDGYGLPKDVAEFICNMLNLHLGGVPEKITDKYTLSYGWEKK
jgi:hypothetical protein